MVTRTEPLLSKKNISPRLQFNQHHTDKPGNYWHNVLWTDQIRVELFGLNERLTSGDEKHCIPASMDTAGSSKESNKT